MVKINWWRSDSESKKEKKTEQNKMGQIRVPLGGMPAASFAIIILENLIKL